MSKLLFNKRINMRTTFFLAIGVPFGILTFLLLEAIPLSIFYSLYHELALLIVLIAVSSVLVIVFGISIFYSFKVLKATYYDGLYKVTTKNMANLASTSLNLDNYPNTLNVNEIDELNKSIDSLKVQYKHAEVVSMDKGYDDIPLNYIDKPNSIITLASFEENLVAIINNAQSYRNAVIEIYYSIEQDTLTKEELMRLVNHATKLFSKYQDVLYIIGEDLKGIYIFIPNVDTFSCLEEQFLLLMKHISVSKKTYDGLVSIPAKFSLVAYPYSNVNEIFNDLAYAKRQGKAINFYFPDRIGDYRGEKLLQTSMSLNMMTKILKSLRYLPLSVADHPNNLKLIESSIKSIAQYLDVDCAGVVSLSNKERGYESSVHVENGNNDYFQKDKFIRFEFMKVLNKVKDYDNSYYFSNRKHMNVDLAREFDKINISSGFYYMINDREKIIGFVYFFNENGKEFRINSYIREALFVLGSRLSDYIVNIQREMTFSETFLEINSTLLLSSHALYRINPESHEITSFSQHLPTLFPKVNWGEKCYKCLYGLDAPCKDCPITTNKKMLSTIDGGTRLETSLSVNVKNTYLRRMLVKVLKDDEIVEDRFDSDLLINSYSSLVLALSNLYRVNSKGYLLLLKVDNIEQLIKEHGSEGSLFILRGFLQRMKENKVRRENIFYFNSSCFAVLFPEVGQVDVVNMIENIYLLSKEDYVYNNTHNNLNITYLPIAYPMSYPTSEDFLKFALKFYTSGNYASNKDFIYFADSDYSRSASRNKFMLSVIDEQFGKKTFSVFLQPMVKAHDKSIFGAELLLRIADDYRKIVFNPDELIKVAAANGKISLISNALVEYIGDIYQQFGLTAFKIYGFNRLTINTDFSYFSDPGFFNTIYSMINTYRFPKEFLGFEITEKEVFAHLEEFRKISKSLLNQRIYLVCDQYSGSYLSIDILKELGFSEVKIGRNMVNGIDIDERKASAIRGIINSALSKNVRVSVVGVENSDQYILLRDINKNILLQGYHFYKPLDKTTFIEALRKNN